MNRSQRSSLAVGVILVLVGVYFILANMVPQFNQWLNITYSWPTIILAVAAGLLVLGLIVGGLALTSWSDTAPTRSSSRVSSVSGTE